MLFAKEKDKGSESSILKLLKNRTFHKGLTAVLTVLLAFFIINSGATPKKYKLELGHISKYNIIATRDIEDKVKTQLNAEAAAAAVPAVMTEIKGATVDVINNTYDFFKLLKEAREALAAANKSSTAAKAAKEAEDEAVNFRIKMNTRGIPISDEQALYLITKVSENDLSIFEKVAGELVTDAVKQDITGDNLLEKVTEVQEGFKGKMLSQELRNIGDFLIKGVIKPNKEINEGQTEAKREEARINPANREVILKGRTIISVGDVVTLDKYELLKNLNLLEESSFDFWLAGGILAILLLLAAIMMLYMNQYCKRILLSRSNLLLLSMIILLTLVLARFVYEYSALAIPIFIAPLLISILFDLRLAVITNFILAIAITVMTKGDLTFLFMASISGTISAFVKEKANQRSTLSIWGIIIGLINALVIVCNGTIFKSDIKDILTDCAIVFTNGIVSVILTIGLLPFIEMIFNVITPLKLLELANPNQSLMKRLLMEAPGTYHHSLMVGNLAEVATEAIGGNSLLARVGAYYHDVGKLKRPMFFRENQLGENPHDKMTANLSTLVITSHTHDGEEIARRYKLPEAIRDIIVQHHGTTLVAFFYHKAKKSEKTDEVKEENFRYEGPVPKSKEAAVVMLADSVEAAVRSMVDKTEGKIEGLIRKIIKDKLDDGQLDQCSLTLKNLDDIAKNFIKVFSGMFHERDSYPDIKAGKKLENELDIRIEQATAPDRVTQS